MEIQAVLNAPELKVHKPSDTRWLARERCVDDIYEEKGDAEAYGLLRTYKFVACLCMLCDVLHTVAKLQGSLQSKQLDLATVPVMVESTISRLKELKEYLTSSTWFNDLTSVFAKLGDSEISYVDQESFIRKVYRPYIQGVIDHISTRLKASDTLSAFSLVDPRNSPSSEDCLHMAQRAFRL